MRGIDFGFKHILTSGLINFRWVYKRMFVADGNFKADHVRQKSDRENVWLSEGGGMVPKREEYLSFLKTAKVKHTVSWLLKGRYNIPLLIWSA